MKNQVKIFVASIVVTIFAIIGHSNLRSSKNVSNELLASNVEALSNGSEGQEYECVLEKDECKFTIRTQAELKILMKLKGGDVGIGAEVDLTNGTKMVHPTNA